MHTVERTWSRVDGPAWSPDGRQLAFVEKPDSTDPPPTQAGTPQWRALYQTRHLWIVNADGSGAHEITAAGDGIASPSWSSDGKHLLYIQHDALWSLDVATNMLTRLVAPVEPVPQFASYGQTNVAPPDAPYEAGSANSFPTWESLITWSPRA